MNAKGSARTLRFRHILTGQIAPGTSRAQMFENLHKGIRQLAAIQFAIRLFGL
jgi:hypothetical protein